MKILQIASGSKGNSTYIESKKTKILLDCGISKKRVQEALDALNVNIKELNAILITHEHVDHVSGIMPIYNATNAKIYLTKGTFKGLKDSIKMKLDPERIVFIKADEAFYINDILVNTIEIFHDAIEPLAFEFENEDKKLVYITDTGYIHNSYNDLIKNANCYIFESNHDPEMLMESDRPYSTIMRILSDHGHLSNQDSAYALSNLIGDKTKYVMFAHISEECNMPEIVRYTAFTVFKDVGVNTSNIKFYYLSQTVSEVIDL